MITPEYLRKGSRIGIVCTGRKVAIEEIQAAVDKFQEWGLEVVLGKNLFKEYHQFAGTDNERAFDLQQMLDDSSIKAIICARGGYGTVRIIDKINFSAFCKKPKWLIGYSDVTVLHSHIHTNHNIETLHATMPFNFSDSNMADETFETLKRTLFGEKISYNLKTSHTQKGTVEGILTGGNLSILYSLIGSASDIDTDGKILFIEDLDEYLYHIDRMMMNLKRAGKLRNLAGLIVGGMTEMKDNTIPFGKTPEEIISEAVTEYKYPIIFDFPSGHIKDNRALILGRKIQFKISDTVTIDFS